MTAVIVRSPLGYVNDGNLLLLCENGHDHIVGIERQEHLVGTPCPWCETPMRRAAWRDGGAMMVSQQCRLAYGRYFSLHYPMETFSG